MSHFVHETWIMSPDMNHVSYFIWDLDEWIMSRTLINESCRVLYMRPDSSMRHKVGDMIHVSYKVGDMIHVSCDSSMRHESMRMSCCMIQWECLLQRDLTILIPQYEHFSTETLLKEGSFAKRDNSRTAQEWNNRTLVGHERVDFRIFVLAGSKSTFTEITEITEYMYFSLIWTPVEFEYKND